MSDGFIGRWSRLKREAARPTATPVLPAEPALPVPLAPDVEQDDVVVAGPVPDRAAADAMSPEEIAALPHPDALTPEADLAPFLRKGVPDLLRKAALRRMWSLDPAIRDAIGDARDYAYDWNVAGGVPGFSPLAADFDAAGLVERMFGREPEPGAVQAEPGQAAADEPAEGGEDAAPIEEPRPALEASLSEDATSSLDRDEPSTWVAADEPAEPEPSRRRRHGGAVPD